MHFSADGEVLRTVVESPLFFVVAKSLLSTIDSSAHPLVHLWLARVLFTQQQLLDTTSATLHDGIVAHAEQFLASPAFEELSAENKALVHLELGVQRHYYREISNARVQLYIFPFFKTDSSFSTDPLQLGPRHHWHQA